MKRKIRKITIGDEKFNWVTSHKTLQNPNNNFSLISQSRLTVFQKENRKFEFVIIFETEYSTRSGHPLVTGYFVEDKEGKEVLLNLNHPKFIREIIDFMLEEKVILKNNEKYLFKNGLQILKEMGYEVDDLAASNSV